ncbi:hypothetical protein ACJA23_02005 [Mycoplasma corogypsi]|uniref:hypothetical protein n=1 Tax=Mycoplasma corogypsi TaxID=2106 RepID=UPI0038733D1C
MEKFDKETQTTNYTLADVEKVKLLAEALIEAKNEVAKLNKELKYLVANTDVPFSETLSNGGIVSYDLVQPKPRFNYNRYTGALLQIIESGQELSEDANEILKQACFDHKEAKWKLSIKK